MVWFCYAYCLNNRKEMPQFLCTENSGSFLETKSMMYNDIYAWLIGEKKLAPPSVREVRDYEKKNKCNPYTAVEKLQLCTEEEINKAVFDIHGIRALERDLFDLKRNETVPVQTMLQSRFIALMDPETITDNKTDLVTYILIPDPRTNIPVIDALKKSGFKGKTKVRWIREERFEEWSRGNSRSFTSSLIDNLANNVESVGSMMTTGAPIEENVTDVDDTAIIDLVNEIIRKAIELGASDIHIEPLEGGCVVRYRLDGVLVVSSQIEDMSKVRRVINRLKVLGNMDVNNNRTPQSGKIQFERNDIRVSTLPSVTGEKVVLRILNNGGGQIRTLAELGVPPKAEAKLRDLYTHPYGIILVSGPTGSGKSSTLAAILKELCTDDVCMITIEDPVEYRIPGAVQVNVNPDQGLTFPTVLRETLRQDPNIIMVGEIRDKETAEISMQAANTGHLVFSTIHTNSAISAITRLNDMGIDGYLVADNIICIISQSLVRKLCPFCKEEHVLTKEDLKTYSAPKRLLGKHVYKQGNGCHRCNHTGYSGRTIAFETLDMTAEIMKAIHDRKPTAEIERIAEEQRFEKKLDYAYGLVENGTTSLREVRRVLGGSNIEEVID